MNAWKPNDEQTEALVAVADSEIASYEAVTPGDPELLYGPTSDMPLRVVEGVLRAPAFQSIIRAAQAEAWAHGHSAGDVDCYHGYAYGTSTNPYKDAS